MTYCHVMGEEHKNNGAFFMLHKYSGKLAGSRNIMGETIKNEGHGECSSLFKFVAV